MKYLSVVFLFAAVLSAVLGAMKGIAPEVVLSTKIALVTSIMLFLITLIGGMAKDGGKRVH